MKKIRVSLRALLLTQSGSRTPIWQPLAYANVVDYANIVAYSNLVACANVVAYASLFMQMSLLMLNKQKCACNYCTFKLKFHNEDTLKNFVYPLEHLCVPPFANHWRSRGSWPAIAYVMFRFVQGSKDDAKSGALESQLAAGDVTPVTSSCGDVSLPSPKRKLSTDDDVQMDVSSPTKRAKSDVDVIKNNPTWKKINVKKSLVRNYVDLYS